MDSLLPGESYGIPNQSGGFNNKLQGLLSNPMFNIGLGILANNNTKNVGQVLGRGAIQGLGNIQQQQAFQMQQNLLNMQLERARQEQARAQQREEALPRLLQGQSAYTTEQETPVQSFQNVPIPAQEGSQAPNFGTTRQSITSMQKTPVFNQNAYTKDLVAAGYADDLIKQQLAPKKIGYRDVGDKLIPYDETTGAPRTDLEPIPKGLTPDAQSNLIMRNFEFNNLSAAQKANNDLTLRGQGITLRGQNLTDARSREANSTGKAPQGYRWSEDGTQLIAIKGGPADKSVTATEGERKAATLLKRLEGSLGQLQEVTQVKGANGLPMVDAQGNPVLTSAAKPELIGSGLSVINEGLGNFAKSSDRQRVEAAQLDMLDAALTLGTGAAYTKEQLEGYRKSYFPQIGDSQKTVQDKQARLNNVIEAAKIAAGRAAPQTNQIIPSGAAGGTINSAFGAGGWSAREKK